MEESLKFTQKKKGVNTALCPTCQNELTQEHYDEIIQQFNKDVELNQNKAKSISQVIENLDKEIKALQNNLNNLNKEITIDEALKEDFENYRKYKLELKKTKDDLNNFLKLYGSKFKDRSLNGLKISAHR